MPDPKLRDEIARQRDREDQVLRQDSRRRASGPPPIAPRHFRGMLPGGRMYGEDDSVIAYFAGHALRGMKALGRLFSGANRSRGSSTDDLRNTIKFRDRDGK